MNMDPAYNEYPDYINSIDFDTMLPNSSQFPEAPTNQYQFDQFSPDFDFLSHQFTIPPVPESGDTLLPSLTVSNDEESLYHDGDLLQVRSSVSPEAADSMSLDDETLFKFVNKMLMEEENVGVNPAMSYDPLAFQVTEKSFYDILGQQYPVSPKKNPQQPLFVHQPNQQQLLYDDQDADSPDTFFCGSSGDVNASTSPSTGPSNSADSQWPSDYEEQQLSILQTPLPSDGVYQFSSHPYSNLQSSVSTANSMSAFGNGISDSSVNQFVAENIFTDSDSVLQFQRGLEEASKFLPKVNPLFIGPESTRVSAEVQGHTPTLKVKKDKNERMNSSNSRRRGRRNAPNGSTERKTSPDGSKGKKNHEREDVDFEVVRSSKQFAIYNDVQEVEDELSELLDKVLLFNHVGTCHSSGENEDMQNEKSKISQENEQPEASIGGGKKTRGKKQGKKKETVDLRNLLILCAQAVSTNDFRTATELLKQIRQHCSPFGDGSQRLAHCFANGLEARMTGDICKPQIRYNALASKEAAIQKLNAYQVSLSACPFKKMTMLFMNKMILKMAENATTLHIVDFGIMYGFQWPILIYKLSKRPGGPPKLRITGIDVPQAGFRPTEWIEDTGRRLARYCARFNVPFEFNAIASQKWESIKVEDLKVERNEMLAVNSMLQFKNLMDETVDENCPKDIVLKLIRSLKPDIFVHSLCNGGYNSPFFVTRFREALFHYSALFDMYDVTLPRDSPERLMFETEFYGVEAMNVIACEGAERNERAETYKQWQVRTQRAGLKPLPLDPETTELFRDQVKEKYHKDFEVDQDGNWLLQGWKGRIVYASSCWVPA